jgi:hypothetical protein
MKKKIIMTGLILALLAPGSGCIYAENKSSDSIKVIYDGNVINFDVEPEIINDRTMVPMRAIFETFGAKVKWDGDTSTVTAKKKSKTISMTIGSTEMTKNDDTYTFDTAPVIEEGRTLVPIRAISDLLGLNVEWDENKKTVTITTPEDEDSDEWKSNTGVIDLTNMTVSGEGVAVDGNVIEITQGGDFEVSGTLADGMIHVNTEEKVKLRLSGASITNSSGPAIYFEDADKCYITLTEGTDNYLSDGETYSDDSLKGCLSAKSNLEIRGKGSLTIDANYNQGIHASDSLEIENGKITINSVGDGIHVNDTFEISDGKLNVTAGGDGIQAEEIVDITGGKINVTTTGEVTASTGDMFGPGGGFGGDDFGEMKRPDEMTDEERQQFREKMEEMMQEMMQKREEAMQQEEEADDSEEGSSKGIKAGWMLDISDGDIVVNSTDHAVHCSSDINISGGDMELASSVKKGISGHGDVAISDGKINITNATEGIESKAILKISGGDIDVACTDDGFNAGGGSDMFGGGPGGGFGGGGFGGDRNQDENQDASQDGNRDNQQDFGQNGPNGMPGDANNMDNQGDGGNRGPGGPGMMGNNSTEVDSEHHIQIDGGNIHINAKGDGIDSNGSLVINGGTVIVDGPVSDGDSALDTDGLMQINGGEVIAIGSSGMLETPSSTSAQAVLVYYYSETQPEGTQISIKNSSGKEITSYTSEKTFQSIVYSSDDLKEGETYTIYSNGEKLEDVTLSDRITTGGTARNGFGGPGGGPGGDGGFGGGPGGNGGNGGFGGDNNHDANHDNNHYNNHDYGHGNIGGQMNTTEMAN